MTGKRAILDLGKHQTKWNLGLDLHCSGSELVYVPINATVSKPFCGRTTGELFLKTFDLESDNLGRDAGILAGTVGYFNMNRTTQRGKPTSLGIWLSLVVFTAVLMRVVRHQKR